MPAKTIFVKVEDLEPFDLIVGGSVLGQVHFIDTVKVKLVRAAEQGKCMVTLFTVGTIFAHGDTLVEVVPAKGSMNESEEPARGSRA
jgi:hypothetical protein